MIDRIKFNLDELRARDILSGMIGRVRTDQGGGWDKLALRFDEAKAAGKKLDPWTEAHEVALEMGPPFIDWLMVRPEDRE